MTLGIDSEIPIIIEIIRRLPEGVTVYQSYSICCRAAIIRIGRRIIAACACGPREDEGG